jgi:hypothetical protein
MAEVRCFLDAMPWWCRKVVNPLPAENIQICQK